MKLILAPMATLSHRALRTLISELCADDCDEYSTEMISAGALVANGKFEKYYADAEPIPSKTTYQVVGGELKKICEAVAILKEKECLGVDINMGCCAPDIYKTGGGVAWMAREEEAATLIKECRAILGEGKALSVKCRLSCEAKFCDFDEKRFYAFIERLITAGVNRITLHPRTRREKYKDTLHLSFIRQLCLRYGSIIEIVANGGVKDEKSLAELKDTCPECDAFMIARAAVQKPWVFSELQGHSPAPNKKAVAQRFIELVGQYLPEEFHRTRLQRFFAYYCENFLFSHRICTTMVNALNKPSINYIDTAKKTLEALGALLD